MAEVSKQQPVQFTAVSHDDWRDVVQTGLRGKSIEDKLSVRTADGLMIQPLYSDESENTQAIPPGKREGWLRQEAIEMGDSTQIVTRMARAAKFGIQGFRVPGPSAAGETEWLSVATDLQVDLFFNQPVDSNTAVKRIRAGLRGGQALEPGSLDQALITAWRASQARPGLQVSSSSEEQSQGAGVPLQVALCLARGAAWLREACGAGLTLEEAASSLEFKLGLGTDLFIEVAKLRALRLVWAKLLRACGSSQLDSATPIHAHSSQRFWTRRDPWVNGLRGTTIAFAGAIGGADSILVAPFDDLLGQPDEEALRLGCNTHAILAEESHLDVVEDPAAGSGYVEALTDDIAQGAWVLFQELERLGDEAQAFIDKEIEGCAEQQDQAIRTRRRGLIGVSEFPNLEEQLPKRVPSNKPSTQTLASSFEDLRDRSDERLAKEGQRLEAFLVNIGDQTDFRPRSGFASNLLAAGGIAVLDNDGFQSVQEALGAYTASKAPIAVIASTDTLYQEHAIALAEGLRERGATVILAGRPGEQEQAWCAAGIQHFIYLGCDVVAVLTELSA
jgi:heterodimeric-type methylmalonyl-CoA mutase beta chain